jgi:hypothetical protein
MRNEPTSERGVYTGIEFTCECGRRYMVVIEGERIADCITVEPILTSEDEEE